MSDAPAAEALYLGPPGEGLFAWLHRAAVGEHHDLGLVVCNPFGFEEVCAHQSLRHVAMAAAQAGVPACRFDYAGCGNSEGDEFQPERLAHWLRSVHRAADALKAATGVQRVCLLGLRLGATLATLAAQERDDVFGVVAIAPVLRGRAYLRELTMLDATGAATAASQADEGLLESAGFVLTREAQQSLATIDLRTLAKAPADHMLVVDRDDMPSAGVWVTELERVGVQVQFAQWPGYSAMMRDPQRAQVPARIVQGVVAWLKDGPLAGASASLLPQAVGAATQTLQREGTAVQETALQIDTGSSRLFGVLTRRAGGAPAPAVLMLNSGSVHHIGPNRLWVQLAREWAAQGVTVLRLDISGIGESPPRPGAAENVVYSAHAGADIAAALAWLRREGAATQCHVMGLCSGGYHTLKAAMAGQYMASGLMINPLTFNWKEGMSMEVVKDYEVAPLAAKFRRQLFTARSWEKLLRGRVDVRVVLQVAWRRGWSLVATRLRELARGLHISFKNDLARELADAARHGIRLKFVFADNAPGFELLEREGGQAIHRMVRRGQASLDFIAGGDHTFTRIKVRRELVALLERRMLAECLRQCARE
jgi:alpha-beta hydrolase superfamily lysophospholipase